jgi:hypothetical protein
MDVCYPETKTPKPCCHACIVNLIHADTLHLLFLRSCPSLFTPPVTGGESEAKPPGPNKSQGAAQRKSMGTVPLGRMQAHSSDETEDSSEERGVGQAGGGLRQEVAYVPPAPRRMRPITPGKAAGAVICPATASSTPEVIPLFSKDKFITVVNGGRSFPVHPNCESAVNEIACTRFPVLGFIARCPPIDGYP